MATPVQENLIAKNKAYAAKFQDGDLQTPPVKKYAVVTCMDSRIQTFVAFGITLGDAHIIRNAGGNAKDALRSLVISQQLLGTKEIVLIKHTGCGMLTFTNDKGKEIVRDNLGEDAVQELDSFRGDFQPFTDLDQAVRDDVVFLKNSRLIPDHVVISGWVYEVETGTVRHIV